MKKNLLIRSFSILFVGVAVLFSCTKDIEDVRLDPTLETAEVLELTANSAKVIGFVVASGSGFTERGVVYSQEPNPTVANTKVVYEGVSTNATFSVTLSGLTHVTKYYVRAYGLNDDGVIYGKEFEFTTLPILPTVTTKEVTDITGTTALTGGEVVDDGGVPVTERGVVYATTPNPTVANNKVVSGDGAGSFSSSITGLAPQTTYFVRAYAINSAGTAYGSQMQFTTLAPLFPTSMYVAGSATAYGWATPGTNPDAVMHRLAGGSNNEGIYWKILHLQGGQGWKISAANWQSPNLNYGDVNQWDPGGVTVTGAGNDYVVAQSGMYIVVLNLRNNTTQVSVRPAAVYGIGDTFGGWNAGVAANLFTVNNTAKTIVSRPLVANGNIRMYAAHPWIPDWWNAEFRVFEGKIEYRGAGGDQGAVPGTTDQVITLNFDNNTGSIN